MKYVLFFTVIVLMVMLNVKIEHNTRLIENRLMYDLEFAEIFYEVLPTISPEYERNRVQALAVNSYMQWLDMGLDESNDKAKLLEA